jgi:hypothetical protein
VVEANFTLSRKVLTVTLSCMRYSTTCFRQSASLAATALAKSMPILVEVCQPVRPSFRPAARNGAVTASAA